MDCLYHKWLDTNDKTGNPIKLVFGVLNYARKNKYPRLHSAFTYIDKEPPSSQLCDAKSLYALGESQVWWTIHRRKDKPIFRFLLLLVAVLVPGLLFSESYDQLALHSTPTTVNLFECVRTSKETIYSVTSFIFIPVYRFIVYSMVGKYIPSLLKMIGVGHSLSLLSTVISLAVESIGYFYSNASHCIFDDNTATGTIPIPIYWVLLIDVANGFGPFRVSYRNFGRGGTEQGQICESGGLYLSKLLKVLN